MAETARIAERTIGVILRDASGAYYALPAQQLAAYRVPEAQRPAVEALVHGEDVVGMDGGVADAFSALYHSLQAARLGAEAPSVHLRHEAASLWLIGY
jgi:hypothetical protein